MYLFESTVAILICAVSLSNRQICLSLRYAREGGAETAVTFAHANRIVAVNESLIKMVNEDA